MPFVGGAANRGMARSRSMTVRRESVRETVSLWTCLRSDRRTRRTTASGSTVGAVRLLLLLVVLLVAMVVFTVGDGLVMVFGVIRLLPKAFRKSIYPLNIFLEVLTVYSRQFSMRWLIY